ncbi:hypothetical protein [Prosthecobacter sp.]|uniref:hypothetical protein n=1 Tax=Prosthecobacter sp. TaxID=1965333 RepID=UPI002ABC55AE|nr:hypothetical protein [Prosthecobacter sp.]MDZ4405197.1 hypothetical protein [Prosthecobacter sp.]
MFEESKAWVFIFIISMLIGLGYTAHYFTSVDSANSALLESKSKLADMNEILVQRKSSWEDVEKISVKNREAMEKNTVLLKAKDILDKRYRTIDGDLKYTVESMKTAVEKLRNSAPGTELGDITLANGKVLRAAKIRKVEESGISLIHADGIGMVMQELLPADLKEKFDLGPDALVPILQAAQTEFLTKPTIADAKVKPRASASMSSARVVEEPVKTSVDDAKVKAIKLKMAELDSRMETYKRTAEQYREQAAKHEGLAQAAKSRGAPSTRHTTDASTILAQASQMERQADTMREERKKLEVELEYASKPQ